MCTDFWLVFWQMSGVYWLVSEVQWLVEWEERVEGERRGGQREEERQERES